MPKMTSLGKDERGGFCTSKLKEYPPGLCRCFSAANRDSVDHIPIADVFRTWNLPRPSLTFVANWKCRRSVHVWGRSSCVTTAKPLFVKRIHCWSQRLLRHARLEKFLHT